MPIPNIDDRHVLERSLVLFSPCEPFDGYRFRGFRGEQQRAPRFFLEGVFQCYGLLPSKINCRIVAHSFTAKTVSLR